MSLVPLSEELHRLVPEDGHLFEVQFSLFINIILKINVISCIMLRSFKSNCEALFFVQHYNIDKDITAQHCSL